MKLIVLIIFGYLAFKTVKRFLQNFKIVDRESEGINSKHADTSHSRYIDESDIEDAEFKDLNE
jgi:hypothetical protein